MKLNYIKEPNSIYKASFECIKKMLPQSALDPFVSIEKAVILRTIHACGDINIILNNIRFSPNAAKIGHELLQTNTPILSDTQMVKAGLLKTLKEKTHCFIDDPKTHRHAKKQNITRAMAAIDLHPEKIQKSIFLIANAPTALFRLIEHMNEKNISPKLIIGMPVGFIGAEESKKTLWEISQNQNIPSITILGKHGGSALSAATLNALFIYSK